MVASIGRRLRMELDLDSALAAAVEEVGLALEAARCFVRLGDAAGELPVVASWVREGVAPLGDDTEHLPVSNLAAREDRTVSVADIQNAPELTAPMRRGLAHLRSLATR